MADGVDGALQHDARRGAGHRDYRDRPLGWRVRIGPANHGHEVRAPSIPDNMSRQQATPAAMLSAVMNKNTLIKRMTVSTQRDESVRAKIAQIDHLNQAPVIKVIKYGNELIKVNLSVKILKLGLDVHYRQVTVASRKMDGWLGR